MRDLATGLALVLVIEGILHAAFPELMRRMEAVAASMPPQIRRSTALLVASVGVVIVWLLRR